MQRRTGSKGPAGTKRVRNIELWTEERDESGFLGDGVKRFPIPPIPHVTYSVSKMGGTWAGNHHDEPRYRMVCSCLLSKVITAAMFAGLVACSHTSYSVLCYAKFRTGSRQRTPRACTAYALVGPSSAMPRQASDWEQRRAWIGASLTELCQRVPKVRLGR